MNIVVLDGYTLNPGDLSWDEIRKLGTLTVYDRTAAEDVTQRIETADIVLTNKTKLSKEVLEAAPRLKYISVLATGYDVVDVATAARLGIAVSNVPVYGTLSVSQFAFSLLLDICNHVGYHDQTVHEGKWEKSLDWCYWDKPLLELQDKTMGIIGYGRIGQATGRIAQAMGMHVIYNDPNTIEGALGTAVSFKELCEQSDVIVLHCALTADNYQCINKESLSWMKSNAIIINNARGGLIHEHDLTDALNAGTIYAAGLDVVSTEPIRSDNPLLKAKNCVITPHMSWGSVEARQRIMSETARNIQSYVAQAVINRVN